MKQLAWEVYGEQGLKQLRDEGPGHQIAETQVKENLERVV